MTAITYDHIKDLEQAGFTAPQAQVLTSPVTGFVAKPELARVEKELTHKIENAESRLEKRMDERFDLVDERFDLVDERFDLVDKRFDLVDKRFDLIEQQLVSLGNKMSGLYSLLKWLIATAIALIPSMTVCFTWVSHLMAH